MRQTAAALGRFITATGQYYDRLLVTAFQDGIAHASEESGVPAPRIDQASRDAVFARLRGYYHPHLVKLHGELIRVVRVAAVTDDIDAWFRRNRYRLDLALTGLLWSAAEAGYALAAVDAQGRPLPLYWVTEGDDRVCWQCQAYASGNPYHGFKALPALPADGSTPCGGADRCLLSVRPPP